MPISVLGRTSFWRPGIWQSRLWQTRLKQSKRRTSGFTLLELMIVLIIVGISLGLVTPNLMKSDEDVLKEESMRLVALMEYAADAASSQGQWLAWRPTAAGYRFLQRDENKNIWQPITTDEVLRERYLPEGLRIGSANNQQATVSTNSLIALSPSGIQSPFQIELTTGKTRRIVRGNILGKVEILNPDLAGAPIL